MIKLKTPPEIELIAEAGKILSSVLKRLVRESKIGVELKDLDRLAEKLIKGAGAEPAFLNYKASKNEKPYRASICASVNEVIVHGFPGNYELKSGDVLKIDLGVRYQDFCADAAITILIGKATPLAEKLVKATSLALEQAIKIARPGKTLGDIGCEIQKTARSFGFSVAKGLTGHGIGRELHEEPTVYNYGERGMGMKLVPGMVLAIEPMFSAGNPEIVQGPNGGWAMKDGSLSAHFEHTVAITEGKAKALTAES